MWLKCHQDKKLAEFSARIVQICVKKQGWSSECSASWMQSDKETMTRQDGRRGEYTDWGVVLQWNDGTKTDHKSISGRNELVNRDSIPDRGKGFSSLLHSIQTSSKTHPASYPMVTWGPMLVGKAAQEWSWPLTSTYCPIQKCWNYTSTPHTPSQHIV
jgi:hypothetical protein